MSKIYVKLVKNCYECLNSEIKIDEVNTNLYCIAKNKLIKDWHKIPKWCPLETGEAVYIISNCKYCEFSDKQGKHPYCNYNGKFIKLKPNQNIPDWCLLKIKENSNENSNY